MRDGFTVLRQVFEPSLLEEVAAASTALITDDSMQHLQRDAFTGSLIPVTKDPAFEKLITHRPTLDALAAMGLDDARFLSGYIVSKPPSSPSLGWHQDAWYWDEPEQGYGDEPVQLFAMFYLTSTSRRNGCLRAIPGTHRREHPLHSRLNAAHSEEVRGEADWQATPAHQTWPDEVDVTVDAGDVVIGDARVLHAAHPNNSTERRTVVTMWFMAHFSSYSAAFRNRTEGLHIHLCADIYRAWPRDVAEKAAPFLPISKPLGEIDVGSCEADEFDHSLDAMVRTPGWTRTDPDSAAAWRAFRHCTQSDQANF